MQKSQRIVTLLTDFGLQDHFVAAMKGTMLNINPDLQFVDITHMVPRHDIASGGELRAAVHRLTRRGGNPDGGCDADFRNLQPPHQTR